MTDGVCVEYIVSALVIILLLSHHNICLEELKDLRRTEILAAILRTHSLSFCLGLLTTMAFHHFIVDCKYLWLLIMRYIDL